MSPHEFSDEWEMLKTQLSKLIFHLSFDPEQLSETHFYLLFDCYRPICLAEWINLLGNFENPDDIGADKSWSHSVSLPFSHVYLHS